MAVTNPPIMLHNAGATHTAEMLRNAFGATLSGARVASSLVARGGVAVALGGALQVTQQGTPNMGVTVASGICVVPGTEGAQQGVYTCLAHTSTNLTVTAAHASLARKDIVIARVYDTQYSGASNTWALEVIAGTPAASPAEPATPNNSIVLAMIDVPAADTSITNAQITDRRRYLDNGIIPVANSAEYPSPAFDGMAVYDRSLDQILVYNGTSWLSGTELSTVSSGFSMTGTTGVALDTFNGRRRNGITMVQIGILVNTAITQGTGNISPDKLIGTLPAGWRPPHSINAVCSNGVSVGECSIGSDGTVNLRVAAMQDLAVGTIIRMTPVWVD